MAATAKDTDRLKREAGVDPRGRKPIRPVLHLSLSWHPDETPDHAHMTATMDSALAALGLSNRQAVYVVHSDRPQKHLHAFVSTIDPETGRSAQIKYPKKALSAWAQEYELKHGIYCEQRLENSKRRTKSKQSVLAKDFERSRRPTFDLKDELTRRYQAAENGTEFQKSVEELGFRLARGKRVVLVGPDGKTYSVSRQLDGIGAADVRKKLADLDLPPVETLSRTDRSRGGRDDQSKGSPARPQAEDAQDVSKEEPRPAAQDEPRREPVYVDRDEQNANWQDSIVEAAIRHQKGEVRNHLLNRLQDSHLDEWGRFFEETQIKRLRLEQVLEGQYGKHERQLRQQIADEERQLAKAPKRVQWYHTGVWRLQEQLANDRSTLASIGQRRAEAVGALNFESLERRQVIEERQAGERRRVPSDFSPEDLDVLARQFEREQAAAIEADRRVQGPEHSGGPMPADRPAPTDHDAERSAFMDRMGQDLSGPSIERGPSSE
jgi:hypothetical protein